MTIIKRSYSKDGLSDAVVVALDLPVGVKHSIAVGTVFKDGETVRDYYSGQTVVVKAGKVDLPGKYTIVLLAK